MPWVRFDRNFDWRVPGLPVVMAYKSGTTANVTRACADAAQTAGAAVPTKAPRSPASDKGESDAG